MWNWGTMLNCVHGSTQLSRVPLGGCGLGRWGLSPSVNKLSSLDQHTQAGSKRMHRAHRERTSHVITAGRGSAAFRELEEGRAERRSLELESKRPVATKLEWSRPLEIIKYPDPRLRAINATVGVFDDSLRQLAREMFEVMYNGDDGVGLAAPQVGLNLRLMVFNPTGKRGDEEVVLVNPKVITSGGGRDSYDEGCLSFPRIFGQVVRPLKVKVKAQDLDGNKFVLPLSGWPARIFQHEYDHLEGVLFHDRMAPEVLEKVKPALVQLEESYVTANPGVPIQRVM